MYNLTPIDPSAEARKEADALTAKFGQSTAARLCQLFSDTAGQIVDEIAAAQFAKDLQGKVIKDIDPAPYKQLILRGEKRLMIDTLTSTGLTKQQAQTAYDALKPLFEIKAKD